MWQENVVQKKNSNSIMIRPSPAGLLFNSFKFSSFPVKRFNENVFNQLSSLLLIVLPTTRHKEATEVRGNSHVLEAPPINGNQSEEKVLMNLIICYDLNFISSSLLPAPLRLIPSPNVQNQSYVRRCLNSKNILRMKNK